MKYLFLIIFLYISNYCFSHHAPDTVLHQGEIYYLETLSLMEGYFQNNPTEYYPFEWNCSCNTRGYMATWEIINNEIFLVGLYSDIDGEIKLNEIFDINEEKIKAYWYSGVIMLAKDFHVEKVPLKYGNYKKTTMVGYLNYCYMKIEHGNVISEFEISANNLLTSTQRLRYYEPINSTDSILKQYFLWDNPNYDDIRLESIKSENDFDLLLSRYFYEPDTIVNIPITYFGIVDKVIYDKSRIKNRFLRAEISEDNSSKLLIIELNNYYMPDGTWNIYNPDYMCSYSTGSTQIVLKLPNILPNQLNLEKIRSKNFHLISRFVPDKTRLKMKGQISFSNITDTCATINGKIIISSKRPHSLQEINLNNTVFPIQSLKQYKLKNKL